MLCSFYLDPFYDSCRQQGGVDLKGGNHLPLIRGQAMHNLCDGNDVLEKTVLREFGSLLRRSNVHTASLIGWLLHPLT